MVCQIWWKLFKRCNVSTPATLLTKGLIIIKRPKIMSQKASQTRRRIHPSHNTGKGFQRIDPRRYLRLTSKWSHRLNPALKRATIIACIWGKLGGHWHRLGNTKIPQPIWKQRWGNLKKWALPTDANLLKQASCWWFTIKASQLWSRRNHSRLTDSTPTLRKKCRKWRSIVRCKKKNKRWGATLCSWKCWKIIKMRQPANCRLQKLYFSRP